jgi:phosphatidylglycerol:prolipoprotein diacylglycerol transferase
MKPILFQVFGKNIYGYGVMMAIAIIAALTTFWHTAKKRGYNEDHILDLSIATVIAGLLGGKLLYVITELKTIIKDPSVLKDIGAGFVVYGALILGGLAVYIYCRKKKWSFLNIIDLVLPSVALGQGFGRIGCLLAGCCYGAETNLRIGIEFKESLFAPSGVHLHPTQIYMSVFDFALAFFLFWYIRKERKPGKAAAIYIIAYSIGRFLVEFLRNDPRGAVGVLSTSQFISIFTLVIGILVLNIDKLKVFKKEKVENVNE